MSPEISRRRFVAGAAGLAGAAVMWPAGAGARPARGPAARTVAFNRDWRFGGPLQPGSTQPGFDDSGFERVTLPHTVTPLSWRRWDNSAWERQWIYRRRFDVPGELSGLRLFVDFGAALTGTAVTLNGRELGEHLGGYLPFSHEITDHAMARDNLLAVALDSRFQLNVPPNRPDVNTTRVDFWQPGGIYRSVDLRAVPQTFIADVFAKPVDVLSPGRRVDVQCTIDSAEPPAGRASVRVALLRDGRAVREASAPVTIDAPGQTTVDVRLEQLGDVALWDVERPELYDVVTTLEIGGRPVHDHATRIGFRDARFTKEGFFLNGERLQIFGVNRHQFFPFAGGAMPDRVQRKDAEITRRVLNCNMVRCSHYPQATAFLDACDELGLLAWDEVPGWALLGDAEWKELVVRDVRDMVIQRRNHPSIVLWGARLNETPDEVALYTRTRDLAHSLDDSRQTTGAMLGSRYGTQNFVQDVFSFNDYRRADGHASLREPRTDFPYLVSEAVGTLSGPARFYRRTVPVEDQQGQAVAHAHVHHIAGSDERYCGLLSWSGFDYPSGTGNNFEGVKYTGVVDLFREPKPGAALYRAQIDPAVRAVIEPAFYWDFGPGMPEGPGAEAMICSNCERLELFVGGEPHTTVEPDRERFGNLPYPPSFADLRVDGSGRPDLRIDGYVGGERVLSRSFASDTSGDALSVTADDAEIAGDGVDATRVAFRALDRYGAARPYVTGDVTIAVDGPADLVGESPFAFEDAGGVGAVWIRSRPGAGGPVHVRVAHGQLGAGAVEIAVRPVAPGGPPAARVDFAAAARPRLVEPGRSTSVTATLRNLEPPELGDAELSLTVPAGWTARAQTPTTFASVSPGQAVEAVWEVTAPAGAGPGQVELTARAAWSAAGEREGRHELLGLVVPTTFERALNNIGTSDDDGGWRAADLDGVGNSYSRQALAATGLAPGAAVSHDGVPFTWPAAGQGEPDNVLAAGQTIALGGAGSRLGLLGSTSRGPITGGGTLHHEDGTTSEYTVTLDDYFNPPQSGNEVVSTMSYINTTNPARADDGVGGRRTEEVYVFYVAVPVQEGKALAGVTLPDVADNVDGGRPGFHVFALGVG